MTNSSSPNYAGDLSPSDAWALLKSEPRAQLVDVRTAPEWTFVGLPDLRSIGREPILIEWQTFPAMAPNGAFADELLSALEGAATPKDTPLLFLCRSGARSRSAAIAMTERGFTRAYNVANGFEGNLDSNRHRGRSDGWKASELPWKQT